MYPAGGGPRDARVLVARSHDHPRVLVVGLGSPDRGDDAVGPQVAALVAQSVIARHLDGVHVVEREDPTALVDLLDPAGPTGAWDAVVVVDAVRSGAAPGVVTILEVGSGGQDLATRGARLDPGPAGTHGFGLAGAIELARALDRLPPSVVVVGVEAVRFDHGAPLSPGVRAGIPHAADTVLSAAEEAIKAALARPGVSG
jgi:hydrogenase maturation protease